MSKHMGLLTEPHSSIAIRVADDAPYALLQDRALANKVLKLCARALALIEGSYKEHTR